MTTKQIIIVDDDKVILDGFKALLELNGYKVKAVENGKEALEEARRNFYNLALIDFKLPDIEGTGLLREFRLLNPQIKLIIVTGHSTRENAIESLNLGADGYLEKPLTPKRLLAVIADKLVEQEAENNLYEKTVNDLLGRR
jgi:two-component system, NtrC family, response regulator PilR